MNLRIVTGDWGSLREDAQKVRVEVFVIEQNVPVELEWDEGDEVSTHAVAYDEQGQPVATGRLLPDGHIGRMAVSQSLRGKGIGKQVLVALRTCATGWPRGACAACADACGAVLRAARLHCRG